MRVRTMVERIWSHDAFRCMMISLSNPTISCSVCLSVRERAACDVSVDHPFELASVRQTDRALIYLRLRSLVKSKCCSTFFPQFLSLIGQHFNKRRTLRTISCRITKGEEGKNRTKRNPWNAKRERKIPSLFTQTLNASFILLFTFSLIVWAKCQEVRE